jgi:hypothetical protein
MSRGRTKIFARVSPTLLAAVADVAQQRGVDQSVIVREALLAYLQPRQSPAHEPPHTPPQPLLTTFLHGLDATTRDMLAEAMARFQGSAVDLVRAIVRQWAANMRDPRVWRGWRP